RSTHFTSTPVRANDSCKATVRSRMALPKSTAMKVRSRDMFAPPRSKREHVAVLFQAFVDLLEVGPHEAVQTKPLDGQTRHDRAVGHAAAQPARRRAAVRL